MQLAKMLMLKISFPRVVLARKVTQVSEGFQIENVGDADIDEKTIENNIRSYPHLSQKG